MLKKIGIVTLVAAVVSVATLALAGTPVQKSITVVGTGAAWTLDRDYAAFRVTHVLTAGAASTTNTIKVVQADGSITNTLGSIVQASGNIFLQTNTIWLFKGDAVRIESTQTNAFNALIVGELQD